MYKNHLSRVKFVQFAKCTKLLGKVIKLYPIYLSLPLSFLGIMSNLCGACEMFRNSAALQQCK